MEDLIILLAEIGTLCGILAVGGLVADYILPHIPAVERFINSLPLMQDDEDQD